MSECEFRPIPPDRLDEYRRITRYAFRPEEGTPGEADPGDDERDGDAESEGESADELGELFGVFARDAEGERRPDGAVSEADELRSVCKHYDFTARLRGEWVPMAGLAAVATPPEHRREGYVRRLIAGSLDRWRGEYPIAALWPFSRSYYRQFGWATANAFAEHTLPTEALAVARERLAARGDPGDWTFRRATPDDWETLQAVGDAYAVGRGLSVSHGEQWWRTRVFRTLGDDRPHVYVCERDGEARGYVVYTFEKTGDGLGDRKLRVSEMAYAGHEARLALLAFLADHDSQAEETVHYAGDTSLLDLLSDPSEADCQIHAGPMVRVVDVAHALETVPYPADATADLTLAVTDETAAWNDGTFDLRVETGHGITTSVDVPAAEADLTVGVGTLSQLLAGYHSVDEARRLDDLSVSDDGVADRLASLFPPQTVYLRTWF